MGDTYLSMKTLSKNVQEEFSKRYYETLCYGDVTEGSFDFIYLLNSDQLNDIISQYIREGKFDFVTQIMNINESRLKLFTTQKLEISPDLEAIESRLERLQNQVENGEACYDDINDLICFIDFLCQANNVPDYHLECYSPFDQEAFADVKMPATSANDKGYQFKQTLFIFTERQSGWDISRQKLSTSKNITESSLRLIIAIITALTDKSFCCQRKKRVSV